MAKLKDWIKKNKFGVMAMAVFLVFAAFVYWFLKPVVAEKEEKASLPVLQVAADGEAAQADEADLFTEEVSSTERREIAYVPKKVDPATGEPEKTDVQIDHRQKPVAVSVNGKEFSLPAAVKEESKFEKGKLVITEESSLKLQVITPKPKFNLGMGRSKNGLAVEMNGPLCKNVSWWVYGDSRTAAGGLQFAVN